MMPCNIPPSRCYATCYIAVSYHTFGCGLQPDRPLKGQRQRFASNSNDGYTQALEGLLEFNLEGTWMWGGNVGAWVPSKLEGGESLSAIMEVPKPIY